MGNPVAPATLYQQQVQIRQAKAAARQAALPGPDEFLFNALGLGVQPGRAVVDSVTGQVVTVVSGGVLSAPPVAGVTSG